MSNRRRPGSWQEGVAKGFSKFFSRTSSQEKEEESEKSIKEPGDEQERGDTGLSRFFSRRPSLRRRESTDGSQVEEQKSQHEPRIFSRRISQDDKEDTEQSSREEQETNKVFSRQSTKESSQEEDDKSKRKDATPEPDSQEDKNTHLMTDSNQNVSSLEQTSYEPDFVTNEQNTPRTKEGIELGLSEDIKVHDSEKQSKENLLHFISNLFHFSPKSAQTNPKTNGPHQELRKDNEEAAINDKLHTETLHDGQSLDECNGVSHATRVEQTFEPSSPVISPGGTNTSLGVTEIPSVLIEGEGNVETPSGNDGTPVNNGTHEDTEQTNVESPTNSSKSPSSNLDAPAVTYGTYRGSKRIRKLLKRRPDVSSPIPEKEETSERETPDIAKDTDSTALHQTDVLKQISDLPANDDHKNDDHKKSSQTIQVEIHSYPKKNSNVINDLQSDTESSNLEPLQPNSKRTPKLSDDLESQERVSNVAENLKVYVTDFPNHTEEEQTILEQKELILPDEDTVLPDSTKSEANIGETLNHGWHPQNEEAIDEVKTIEHGKNSKDQQQTIKDRLDLQDNIYPRDYGSLKTQEDSIGLTTEHQQSDKEKISGNEHYKLRGEHKTHLSEEMRPPETDYEVSVIDMEEPRRGATDPVKSAMDFLPHPGPVLDTPSYIEENAINVEGYQTNEGDLQYSADRNLHPKKSMKTSNVNCQPMGRESPTSVGELRPNNCPPDEEVTRESPEDLQISHVRINNTVEGEELHNISLIRGDSNVHHQSAPMTIEEFSKGVGGISGAFDYSQPVLESDLFTTKSAREKSDGNKNGDFIQTQEHTQPGSDIEYNEPEFTANAEAEAYNEDQSVSDSEDNSSTLVNWTPHDMQSNEISTLAPSFSEDVTISMKFPDVTHVPRPRLNLTEDICTYPVNADLASDGNLVANEFNDFHSSFRVTENNSPVKPKNTLNTLEVHHQSAHEAPMTIEEFKKGVTGNPGTFDYSRPVLESDLFTSKSARENTNGNKNGDFIQTQEHTQPGSDIEYNEPEFTANAEAYNDDQSMSDSEDNSSTLVNWTPHDMQSNEIGKLSPFFSEDVTRSLKLPDATYLPRPRLNFTEDVCTSPVTTDSTSDGNMVANNELNDFHPSFRVTKNNSPVEQTTPALSFDNSVDFLSSPHTTSSQSPLSPAGYISLRADSPLPSSDGIDSGVVSSQAYTPEENTVVNISPSELYNNLAFASNQKPNPINLIEPNKEILEKRVSANSHFDSTNKLGILPKQTEEHVSGKKEGTPTRNSSYTNDNEIPLHRCLNNDESMDKNASSVYREHNDSLNLKPGDVHVAKVCVKSVDVEAVKMTPRSLKTEVVVSSKLVAPRFEPEFISLPNVPSSPPDKDSENLRNNNVSPHSEPTDGIVSNVDNIQTKPRDSSDLLHKYQQEQDDKANPCWNFENNQNFMPNDEDMSLSPDVRREPTGNLPYPKSKHPCISSDAERVNNFMEVIPEIQPSDGNLSDTINSHGNVKNVTVAFVNGKNEETSDRKNVVNHDALLELQNANYIPSDEINANALTPQDPSLQSTITSQKIGPEINSTEITYDQKHINDVIVNIRPHKKASSISEETLSLLKPEYKSEETENAVTELTPNVQFDFSSGTTSQDIEQIADYGNDIVENQRLYPSETNPEYDSSFSVHNGFYVEIGESDEETVDEENDADGEDLDPDSQSSMQIRRVPFYPISLSPIYEDDSSSEDVLSKRASPRCIEGKDESTNANDHTSILSLLQSVSNRLKEEGISSLDNENKCNKVELTQTTNETENATSPCFQGAAIINDKGEKSTDSTETSQGASRHGLFITKSIIDNRPVLGLGRKSIFLHTNSQVGTYGSKSSSESTPLSDSDSKTPGMEEKSSTLAETESSTDLSDSAPVKPPATSPLPDITVQASDTEPKPLLSPKSVYYQYFNDVSNHAEHTYNKKSNKQEKMDSSQKSSPQKAVSLMRGLSNSDAIKSNPRPGKVVISDLLEHEMKFEMYSDILDATSLIFPNGVNIRVIRGCWILYEKPDFQGQAHVLEEGEAVLQQLWGPPESKSRPEQVIIGSIKRVTKDYLPEVVLTRLYGTSGAPICLRTEIPSLKKHLDSIPRSLEVIAGVWLAYTDPQFTGSVSVLEEGSILPSVLESGIQSMRPLKLGGLKVQLPSQPRIILYQKPYFEGWSKEITDHVYSIKTMICEDHVIGSIKVIGGIWVGYEKERYKGTQYLLEEGEYEDWNAWGGISDTLQSIRYLHADVLETSVTLFESEAEDGKLLDLFNQAVPDLESSGYRRETQCIHVKKGIWVAYEQKYFCGEQYILEKGRYKSCMDWGGKTNTIMSIRPVMLEPLGKEEPKHMMAAFSDENFQGQCEYHVEETCEFPEFPPRSFKVLRGCWLLCYQADTCENLCVLEEGNFPDLVTCGCPAAVIKYIKPIDYVFAEPAISLFALDLCEGRELSFEEPVTSVLSKDLNFYTQSVWIRRGLWIAFEGPNFLGQQLLLEAGQILNWTEYSGWKAIGSLRPLKQTPVYFRIKNRHNDKYLTLTGTLTDTSATFVCVSARNGQNTQIWYFCRGLLKSKATDSCLDVIGGKNLPGAKVSLWVENGKPRQKWRINKDGTITSYLSDDLVVDLKGGNFYDQNYIVVNRVQQDVATQKWDVEIL